MCMFSIWSSFSHSSTDIAMATKFDAKLWPNYLPPTLIALAFRNGMGFRYLNERINSMSDVSIPYENFVEFGAGTSRPKKTGVLVEYLRIYWTDFRCLFTIRKRFTCRWWIYTFFQFVKEQCHNNQMILWEMRKEWRRTDITCTLCTSVWNELEYYYLYVRINSSDDQAISDINLVGFWPVPPEFNCVEQASISDRVSISTFARWQHGYPLLLPVRGRHCGVERAVR